MEHDGVDFGQRNLSDVTYEDVRFDRCRFDGADLSRTVILRGSVTDSTMVRATLRDVFVAGARWERVDLTRAGMSRFSAERTLFRDVTFPALGRVEFTGCVFEDCRFTGRLRDVRFLGRVHPSVLRNVVFSSDDFHYAEFDGTDFEGVRFPESDALIVVPRAFRAVAELAGRLSSARRDEVGRELRRFLSEQSLRPGLSETAGWVASRRDFGREELADFAARTIGAAWERISTSSR
ncbi:pentapeptide repeat-containing protein [Actinoplanes sp. CA-131856]